jgi:hypothetical protein
MKKFSLSAALVSIVLLSDLAFFQVNTNTAVAKTSTTSTSSASRTCKNVRVVYQCGRNRCIRIECR